MKKKIIVIVGIVILVAGGIAAWWLRPVDRVWKQEITRLTVHRDGTSERTVDHETWHVKGAWFRLEGHEIHRVKIVKLDTRRMWELNTRENTYRKIDIGKILDDIRKSYEDTQAEQKRQRKRMKEMIADVPEGISKEQHERMVNMIRERMQSVGARTAIPVRTKSKIREQRLGRTVRKRIIRIGKDVNTEMWYAWSIRRLARLPDLWQSLSLQSYSTARLLRPLWGFPLETRKVLRVGKDTIITTTTVTEYAETPVDASLFAIPDGYALRDG